MKSKSSTSVIAAVIAAATSSIASAQNTFYAPGDLVLFFQQENSPNTVYANLGPATTFRGAAAGPGVANSLNFLDLNTTLTSAFGAGWASDPTVYSGLAGLFSQSGTSLTVTNGDPARTLYVSASRGAVGTVGQAGSAGYTVTTNTGMTTGSNGIYNQNNLFEVTYDAQAAISPVGTSFIDDQNTFLGSGIQGPAFGIFASGVQQQGAVGSFGTFGVAGNVEFALDLYRILAKEGVAGQVAGTGTIREGTYEGTITVNSSGKVSFIGQGATSSAYSTWIAGFTTITDSNDKLETADPDEDGATNLEEFAFGGNPENSADQGGSQVLTADANADTLKDITLTLEVRSGAMFSASGNDLVSGLTDELTYRVEGSTDLVNWDSAVSEVIPQIGSGSPSSGYVFKTFRLNGGNGLVGKGFLRASVVK